MRDTPAGYSCVHYAVIQPVDSQQRINPQYCVHHELADRPMRFVNQDDGVQVFIEPCRVAALVEFHAPPHAPVQWAHDPAQWRVGFVQAVMSGSVIYEYGHGGAPTVRAAIGPKVTPCRDSDGVSVYFDHGARAVQTFGVSDADQLVGPDAVDWHESLQHPPHVTAFLTGPTVRHVATEDGPGSGTLPIKLPCEQAGDPRAQVGRVYTIGWTDPLDPGRAPGAARLQHIGGSMHFKTWLVMQYMPEKRLYALHLFEWEVTFDLGIRGPLFTKGGRSGSRLVRETPVKPDLDVPIGAGLTANAMACVKFLPLR